MITPEYRTRSLRLLQSWPTFKLRDIVLSHLLRPRSPILLNKTTTHLFLFQPSSFFINPRINNFVNLTLIQRLHHSRDFNHHENQLTAIFHIPFI
ncbi:hypothetical protein EYC84_011925 [Monilinia fructicola]|uniref:Uncharacterized protein n=1 Tax=Monilinia fructicola TaxID=38448 RepID=A0A5M9J5I3_MONFR|nr:hypothetical protein EYC84_011925 [Monilinia fructicola]